MNELINKTGFVWLMSNLYMEDGVTTIGGLPRTHVVEYNSIKIGIIALCEEEWFELLDPLTVKEKLVYRDFVQTARELSHDLKQNHGCRYIIALTHMRLINDRKLAT